MHNIKKSEPNLILHQVPVSNYYVIDIVPCVIPHSHYFCCLATEVTHEAGPCREEEDARVLSAFPSPGPLLNRSVFLPCLTCYKLF